MPYSIALGGTGAVTAAGARVNLGIQQLIDDIDIDITSLESRVTINEGDISQLQSDFSSLGTAAFENIPFDASNPAYISGLASVALSGAASDISGLALIATSGSADDLSAGTVPPPRIVSSNGLVARTSASTWAARTITGTASQITVTNGDGVSGNPTLALDASVYRRANILGTVSQSGGVPTGAIIERGSNANGEYVRYADGTQICWSPSLTAVYQTSSTMTAPWTFPAAFVNTPFVANQFSVISNHYINQDNRGRFVPSGGVSASNGNSTANYLRLIDGLTGFSENAEITNITAVAIGRWF